MDEQLKSNLTSSKHWIRLIYMLLFALLLQLALGVMWVLVAVQFLFALITGNDNKNLRAFCDGLSQYIFQTIRFLTYNSEEKPFPFSDWPEATAVEGEPAEVADPVSDAVVEAEPADAAESSTSEQKASSDSDTATEK